MVHLNRLESEYHQLNSTTYIGNISNSLSRDGKEILTRAEEIPHWNIPLFVDAHRGNSSVVLITFIRPDPPSRVSTSSGDGGSLSQLESYRDSDLKDKSADAG